MVERVIDAWCCQCKCLVLRETTMSEITSLGWSASEEGYLCPNCTYYATRVVGGPLLLPPPDYSVMRPRLWDGEPGHWEFVRKNGKVRPLWVPNTTKPKFLGPTLCRLFGHKVEVGVCPRCAEDIKLVVKVEHEVGPEPPYPFGIPTRDRRKSRYEAAKSENKKLSEDAVKTNKN